MLNVALCVPHAGKVNPMWYRHVMGMQAAIKTPMNLVFIEVDLMVIGKARNMCVETAKSANADVVWFIDDDVLIPENASILVDQALSLGVVSGVYYSRRFPYMPQIYEDAAADGFPGKYWPKMEWPENDVFTVDAIGAGCVAISTPVFDRLLTLKDKVAPLSPWFEFLDHKGEDMYFCERCKEIDQKIWVNPQVKCGHIGEVTIDESHFRYLRDNNMLRKELKG